MANVGKNIKYFRTKNKMTQDELAEKLFVSRQTVSNYENNKSNPDIDILVKISEVLGTDVNTLIYGEKNSEDKRRRIIKWVVSVAVLLIFAAAVFKAESYFKDIASRYYIMGPRLIIRAWGYPLIFACAGWLFAEAILMMFGVEPKRTKAAAICHWAALGVTAAYFILILPLSMELVSQALKRYEAYRLRLDFSYSLSGGLFKLIGSYIIFYSAGMKYMLFAIPGAIMRATGGKSKLKHKKEDNENA